MKVLTNVNGEWNYCGFGVMVMYYGIEKQYEPAYRQIYIP